MTPPQTTPPQTTQPQTTQPQQSQPPMSAGRIIALVMGVIITLASVAGLAVGGALAWLDEGRRDSAGFVTSDQVALSTTGYAITSENLTIDTGSTTLPQSWFGDARVRVSAADGTPIFVGLASSADVSRYLAGAAYTTVKAVGPNRTTYDDHAGQAPSSTPAELNIWRVQASGQGQQTITWPFEDGDWTLVVMAADGSRNFSVRTDVGATAPALEWAWIAVLTSAGATLLLGVALVLVAALRQPKPGPSALQPPRVPPVE